MHGCVFYTSMIYDMRYSALGKYPMHWVLAYGRTGQTKRTEDGRGGEAGGYMVMRRGTLPMPALQSHAYVTYHLPP